MNLIFYIGSIKEQTMNSVLLCCQQILALKAKAIDNSFNTGYHNIPIFTDIEPEPEFKRITHEEKKINDFFYAENAINHNIVQNSHATTYSMSSQHDSEYDDYNNKTMRNGYFHSLHFD